MKRMKPNGNGRRGKRKEEKENIVKGRGQRHRERKGGRAETEKMACKRRRQKYMRRGGREMQKATERKEAGLCKSKR